MQPIQHRLCAINDDIPRELGPAIKKPEPKKPNPLDDFRFLKHEQPAREHAQQSEKSKPSSSGVITLPAPDCMPVYYAAGALYPLNAPTLPTKSPDSLVVGGSARPVVPEVGRIYVVMCDSNYRPYFRKWLGDGWSVGSEVGSDRGTQGHSGWTLWSLSPGMSFTILREATPEELGA